MHITIAQSKFLRYISIFIFLNCLAYGFLMSRKDEMILLREKMFWIIIVLGLIVSVNFFLLSFWIYVIDENGITIESKLTKSKRYFLWKELKYVYYDVNYRGDTTLIVSSRRLDYTEKRRALSKIYWDPVLLDNVFRLRFDPNSETGEKISEFINNKYGVSLVKFHRI